MLGATLLGTLLVLTALSVLPAIGRSRSELSKNSDSQQRLDGFYRLLEWDLENARQVEPRADGVTLSGFNSLDPSTLRPRHRPVQVVYRVEEVDGKPRLLRRQTALDVQSNQGTWVEVVTASISAVRVTPIWATMPGSRGATTAPSSRPSVSPIFARDQSRRTLQAVDVSIRVAASADSPEVHRRIVLK
jgi:hypothetical protein